MKNIKEKRKNRMARFRHISTKMVLVLDAGTVEGKKIRKRVTIGNIREDASPDALWELAEALGKLLEHPVAKVLLYKEEELERYEGDIDRAADETGSAQNEGVQKEGVTKNAGAEKDAGDDSGVGETQAAYSTVPLRCVRDNGDFASALRVIDAENGRSPPAMLSKKTTMRAITATYASLRPISSLRGGEDDEAIQYQTRRVVT